MPSIPNAVGPFIITGLLEETKIGPTYIGLNPETGESVAIRTLSKEFLDNEDFVKQFLDEAAIIYNAKHKNLIRCLGYGRDKNEVYVTLEYIQGISLTEYLSLNGSLPLKRAVNITLSIANGLSHLHSRGIVHSALSPDAILVTDAEDIKIIDFGIVTKYKLSKDSPYLSPEQKLNNVVTYSSNIYSLGAIAYTLITGNRLADQFYWSQVPQPIQGMLFRATQVNPQDRYPDIVDLMTELQEYLNVAKSPVKKSVSYLEALYRSLENVQETMLPKTIPNWEGIRIGLIHSQGVSIAGIYYDFIHIVDGNYVVLMAEPSAKGVEGVVYMAMLRGVIKATLENTRNPIEVATRLNRIMVADETEEAFSLSFLLLSQSTNKLRYISCGDNRLWIYKKDASEVKKITMDNLGIGIDPDFVFHDVEVDWKPGDSLLVNTFAALSSTNVQENTANEEFFKKKLIELIQLPPQEQLNNLFQSLKDAKKGVIDRSISFINILRER